MTCNPSICDCQPHNYSKMKHGIATKEVEGCTSTSATVVATARPGSLRLIKHRAHAPPHCRAHAIPGLRLTAPVMTHYMMWAPPPAKRMAWERRKRADPLRRSTFHHPGALRQVMFSSYGCFFYRLTLTSVLSFLNERDMRTRSRLVTPYR